MSDIFSLNNKNIVISGASSGIGRKCASVFAELGANVILFGRNEERLKAALAQLAPGKHCYFPFDITDYSLIEPAIQKAAETTGRINGFVHSAGIELTLPLRNMSAAQYESLFAVNVTSGFELAKIISKKKYIAEEGASFVYLSSVKGIVGQECNVCYCASKGAIIAGVKAMALELASKKIRVNSVSPAFVETEMTLKAFENISEEAKKNITDMHPLGLGKPEDVANLCAFLLSDASKWVTGSNIVIDGGYSAR